MVKYLLDTKVLVGCLRRDAKLVETVERNGKGHDLAISGVTFGDLMVGIFKNDTHRRRAALNKVLAPMRIIDFEREAATEFARIKSGLEKSGRIVGPYDMQIAAHAIASGRRLVTDNGPGFSRIDKLDIEDWEG